MKYTEYLKLRQPEFSDPANILDMSENMGVLDERVKAVVEMNLALQQENASLKEYLDEELANKANNERGSWTPRLTGSEQAGDHQYEVQIGEYHMIGDEVSLHFFMRISNIDQAMSGDLTITGLPFPCGQVRAAGTLLYMSGVGSMPYPVPMIGITEQAVHLRLACSNGERTTVITREHITLDGVTLQGSVRYSLEV